MPKYVTKTGRCNLPGRVTRASLAVKKKHDGRPLPIHLQCHPKALTKTPRHPGCIKRAQPHWGLGLFRLTVTREDILNGAGLEQEPKRYSVVHTTSQKILGYTDDITLAMAYKVRGEPRALYLEVVDNG